MHQTKQTRATHPRCRKPDPITKQAGSLALYAQLQALLIVVNIHSSVTRLLQILGGGGRLRRGETRPFYFHSFSEAMTYLCGTHFPTTCVGLELSRRWMLKRAIFIIPGEICKTRERVFLFPSLWKKHWLLSTSNFTMAAHD